MQSRRAVDLNTRHINTQIAAPHAIVSRKPPRTDLSLFVAMLVDNDAASSPHLQLASRAWQNLAGSASWNMHVYIKKGQPKNGPISATIAGHRCHDEPHCHELTDYESNSEAVAYLRVWEHIFKQERKNYDWFLVLDERTYYNPERLHAILAALQASTFSRKHWLGLPEFNGYLQTEVCSGKTQMLGATSLTRVGPHIDGCLEARISDLADFEFARCLTKYDSSITCNNVGGYFLAKHGSLSATYYDTALIQSVPDASAMIDHLNRVNHYIRPPIIRVDPAQGGPKACVNNPVRRLQLGYSYLPECPSPERSRSPGTDLSDIPVFVLNLQEHMHKFRTVRKRFMDAGFRGVHRFSAVDGIKENIKPVGKLKPGELGYRESMRRLILTAKHASLERFIVLDDDAAPHIQFREKFSELIDDARCGGYMMTSEQGGVMLLGTSVWGNGSYPKMLTSPYSGGWNIIEADIRNASYPTMCFNVCGRTLGSFAVFLHQSVYDPILEWLASNEAKPYDWVWAHLADSGFIVRAAYPNLAVADTQGRSQVDPQRTISDVEEVAKLKRWDLTQYVAGGH